MTLYVAYDVTYAYITLLWYVLVIISRANNATYYMIRRLNMHVTHKYNNYSIKIWIGIDINSNISINSMLLYNIVVIINVYPLVSFTSICMVWYGMVWYIYIYVYYIRNIKWILIKNIYSITIIINTYVFNLINTQ